MYRINNVLDPYPWISSDIHPSGSGSGAPLISTKAWDKLLEGNIPKTGIFKWNVVEAGCHALPPMYFHRGGVLCSFHRDPSCPTLPFLSFNHFVGFRTGLFIYGPDAGTHFCDFTDFLVNCELSKRSTFSSFRLRNRRRLACIFGQNGLCVLGCSLSCILAEYQNCLFKWT